MGANISLFQTGAPADRTKLQTAPKCVTQPKGSLVTTESLLLLLNKLPVQARTAHRAPGISNNLLATSELADAGCELIFHETGCTVIHNGEIILQGWSDPATCLWQVSLIPDGSNNIIPQHTNLSDLYETPENSHANSIHQPICECRNTKNLINFYYATMGYPVLSTWCKAINKDYF